MSATEVAGSGPIFVVGTMRSGSTLFRLILDSHENISIGEETGFAGAIAATKAIPNWRYGREWYGRLGWTEDELDERLRDFYGGMFERHALAQGKKRWGDKTPFHSWHMAEMARIFPDAVFVAIVRHPGAVVTSLKKRFHYGVAEAADYWTSTNLEVLRNGESLGSERFALLRYEDLVQRPAQVLPELMEWLQEPWSDALLRHHEVQTAKGAPRLVDGSTSTRAPIDPDRADAWQRSLQAAELQSLRARTDALARFLGYRLGNQLDAVEVVEPMVPPGTEFELLLTGGALARRHREWLPPISFQPPATPAVVAEMSEEDLTQRVARLEASLARIRARPAVRASDALRRAQRRLSLPTVAELRTVARRTWRRLTGRAGTPR